MIMNEKIVIFGCGGHSRSVVDILLSNTKDINLIFVDENAREGEQLFGFPIYKHYDISDEKIFICIGDNYKRSQIFNLYLKKEIINIISKKTHLGFGTQIGKGCFIGNFVHLGPFVRIGDNTIANNGAIIDHEVTIGNHCHIAPNATISGRSVVGDYVFIGVGATVIDKVSICSNVIIGAGAVVTKDITEPGTYVGVPAVKIK